MKKNRDGELAAKDNIKPTIDKALRELVSGYKQILLEGLDKLEKIKKSDSPGVMAIYRTALDDVRQLIKTEKIPKKRSEK